MPEPPLKLDLAATDLEPASIPAAWILDGEPKTGSKNMVRTHDLMDRMVLWECTAGRFTWHYSSDEVLIVISGEAFLLKEGGEEQRFGPGEIGFFPAGTTAIWRVPGPFRKVAVLHEATWRPVGFCLKALNKTLRILGLKGRPALTLVLAVLTLWNH